MTKIANDSIQFLKINFFAISVLTLWIELPFIVIINLNMLGNIPPLMASGILIFEIGFIFFVNPFSIGAQAVLYSQIINEPSCNLRKCLSVAKKNLLPLVYGSFYFLILFLGGLLLFIIPGILIGARLSFFPFFIIFEGQKPISALKKSYSVTEEYIWQIVVPLCFFNCLLFGLYFTFYPSEQDTGVISYIVGTTIELISALFGWINLIVPFRVYSLYRSNRVET